MPLVVYILACVYCTKRIEITALDWEPVIKGWKLIKKVAPTKDHQRTHVGWCPCCVERFSVEGPVFQPTTKK